MSFDFQTLHIRNFLRAKGVLQPKQKLRLKDVNEYLKLKLKLATNPARSKKDVVPVWEKLLPDLLNVQSD